jgi:hypothetical protein
LRIEHINDLGEIGKGAGQAIDLIDDDDIDLTLLDVDLTLLDVAQELLQGGPLHGTARETTVVIDMRDHDPSFVPLTLDKGLAGLTLGIE